MDESDFGKGIFSDDDEIPVDMEMLKGKINLVPLADMDFGEAPDDLMDIDCSIQDNILAPLSLEASGQMDFKDSLKLDIEHCRIKTNEEETVLKQAKIEAFDPGLDVGGTTAAAAKVAAEVSADIVAGGVVAESGPPPDFSSWTVEDDILLKNAMEVGAAVEALAKGAVKFSQRYTLQELRARWRALLYDPVISQECAVRMMKSDACLPNPTKLTNLNRLKYPQVSNKKRKLKSVRASYYKMRKKMAAELSTNPSVLKAESEGIESLSGIVSSKDSDLCLEENMFSQMFELFASGGVGEVVQAVPSGLVNGAQKDSLVANLEHKDDSSKADTNSQEHMVNINESNSLANSQLCLDPLKVGSGTDNLKQKDEDQQNHTSSDEPNTSTAHMLQKSTSIIPEKGDIDTSITSIACREGKAICAIDLSNRTERIDVSNIENMTCVLNTEDTDIPSPPPGSALRVPSLFSNMYFASEIKSEKSELGRTGAGYEGGDDFIASKNELLPLITEDKSNADVVVKPEPCSEALDTMTAHGVRPSSASADTIPQTHVINHPMSQSEVAAGSINESIFPSVAGGVGPLEQEFRYIDESATSLTTMKGGGLCQDYSDSLESEDELPNFSDVEAMILDMDLDPVFDEDALARAESRRLYRRHRKTLMRLEQGANAALDRALTLKGAIAIFYGYHLRYFITKNEVTLGRMTLDNAVDIDLGKEGRANKVSRKQATIKLKKDGVFYLKNLGRRDLSVNNIPIPYGQHAHLGSNCLIEVGGMRFVFEINKKLVKQHVAEMLNAQQQQHQQHGGEAGIKGSV